MKILYIITGLISLLLNLAYAHAYTPTSNLQGANMAFILNSTAFDNNGTIPAKFTCDGENISPELHWQGEPSATKSFVLIMDDPDAPSGTWDHWLLFNIPANTHALSQQLISLPEGAKAGKNSWGKMAYGSPCPPDKEHSYSFRLYALDIMLNLSNPDKSQLESAMQGHILSTAELIGKYDRKRK